MYILARIWFELLHEIPLKFSNVSESKHLVTTYQLVPQFVAICFLTLAPKFKKAVIVGADPE